MKYYPLNRVKVNQKTNGTEFLLNGVPYSGRYYETFDGEYYTGVDPIKGPSQRLVPIYNQVPQTKAIKTSKIILSSTNNIYNSVAPQTAGQLETFKIPVAYYPYVTEDDYKRKFITRYFAKKRNQPGYILEVDKQTHDSLKNTDSEYDYITYEAISTFWQIVGPLHDDRTNKQYKVAGIIDTNKRLIEAKEPGFTGLIAFIGGDYTKFARPTTK